MTDVASYLDVVLETRGELRSWARFEEEKGYRTFKAEDLAELTRQLFRTP